MRVLVERPVRAAPAPVGAALPVLLLRRLPAHWEEVVSIAVCSPTLALTRRDLRRPGWRGAVTAGSALGFSAVVRAPGGLMAAYGPGSVVIDHVIRREVDQPLDPVSVFAANAGAHARVLRRLGIDARIGALPGEYCPGEHSINLGGRIKIVGSAQRVIREATLVSTVVQVHVEDSLRRLLVQASAALGYELDGDTIGGITDQGQGITLEEVRSALTHDYVERLELERAPLPSTLDALLGLVPVVESTEVFDPEAWHRETDSTA